MAFPLYFPGKAILGKKKAPDQPQDTLQHRQNAIGLSPQDGECYKRTALCRNGFRQNLHIFLHLCPKEWRISARPSKDA
jgi:hypothetical protein